MRSLNKMAPVVGLIVLAAMVAGMLASVLG